MEFSYKIKRKKEKFKVEKIRIKKNKKGILERNPEMSNKSFCSRISLATLSTLLLLQAAAAVDMHLYLKGCSYQTKKSQERRMEMESFSEKYILNVGRYSVIKYHANHAKKEGWTKENIGTW